MNKYTHTPCMFCGRQIEYLYFPTKENPESLLDAFDVTFKCDDGSIEAGNVFKAYICVTCFKSKIAKNSATYIYNTILPSLGPKNLPDCLEVTVPDEYKKENSNFEDETVFNEDLGVRIPKAMKNKIEAVLESVEPEIVDELQNIIWDPFFGKENK